MHVLHEPLNCEDYLGRFQPHVSWLLLPFGAIVAAESCVVQ